VGRLFTSFEEAWSEFLAREEPLADFFASLPPEEAFLTTWLALPGEAVRAEARAVQEELAVDGLRLIPGHFLHVSLGSQSADLDAARKRLAGFGSFEARYGPVSCFPDAPILEARSERFIALAAALGREQDFDVFLPHLSLGYFEGPPVTPVREAIVRLRDREPVSEAISEVHLCVVPVARGEILSPWSVAGVVPLD
jgi:hypothetical protein